MHGALAYEYKNENSRGSNYFQKYQNTTRKLDLPLGINEWELLFAYLCLLSDLYNNKNNIKKITSIKSKSNTVLNVSRTEWNSILLECYIKDYKPFPEVKKGNEISATNLANFIKELKNLPLDEYIRSEEGSIVQMVKYLKLKLSNTKEFLRMFVEYLDIDENKSLELPELPQYTFELETNNQLFYLYNDDVKYDDDDEKNIKIGKIALLIEPGQGQVQVQTSQQPNQYLDIRYKKDDIIVTIDEEVKRVILYLAFFIGDNYNGNQQNKDLQLDNNDIDFSLREMKSAYLCLLFEIFNNKSSNNTIIIKSIKRSALDKSGVFDVSKTGYFSTLNSCYNDFKSVNIKNPVTDIKISGVINNFKNILKKEINFENASKSTNQMITFLKYLLYDDNLIENFFKYYDRYNKSGGKISQKTKKVYIGPLGGKYLIINGVKKYI